MNNPTIRKSERFSDWKKRSDFLAYELPFCRALEDFGLIEFISRIGTALHLAEEMGQHKESAGCKKDDTDNNVESRAA